MPVNGFKWIKKLSKSNEDFKKNCDENRNKGYILEIDAEHPKNLFNFHKNLPFLAERKKIEKCNKLVCNIHGYAVHIRALIQALNQGLLLKNYIE